VVRAAYIGEKLGDTSALENPASLEEIKRLASEVRLPAWSGRQPSRLSNRNAKLEASLPSQPRMA